MKQLFLNVNSGAVELIETPVPTCKDGFVLVETAYSAVSAGTERTLTAFGNKNLIQKVMERPDQAKKVLEKAGTDGILTTLDMAFRRLNEPMPIGYSAVGKVLECGKNAGDIYPGDWVAIAGQAYHAQINRVNKNLCAKLPESFPDKRQAAFCALGGIALQGIHQCEVAFGETVAVIGMGLVGHITARILNAYGCDVIGYDLIDKKVSGTGIKAFINSDDENAVEATHNLTKGRGVDKVIITAAANNNQPMDLAAAIARDRAIICMIGVTQMKIDRRPYYEKELTFKIARSYGPGRYDHSYEERGVDYPIGQVRFTEGRNLEEFIRLIATKKASFSDLITHEIAFDEASRAYEMINTNTNKERYIGILLKYEQKYEASDLKKEHIVFAKAKAGECANRIGVGLIGAGVFARNTMLPAMRETGRYSFIGLATTGGTNAAQAMRMQGFQYATNDHKKLLEDEAISLIVIATRHDTHAKFIVEALQAGKHVYCEKPLCLSMPELEAIKNAYNESSRELFCGLNRRYAPFIQNIKNELKTDKIPAIYQYTVNAGYIPGEHWTQDEAANGGRLIGEACHFIDTIQFLDASALCGIDIAYVKHAGQLAKDNALITLNFASGSVGNILYTSLGSKNYPKEVLKVFGNGAVVEMNNFVKMTKYGSNRRTKQKLRQDKGFANEYNAIYNMLQDGQNDAIQDAFVGHELLIKALQ